MGESHAGAADGQPPPETESRDGLRDEDTRGGLDGASQTAGGDLDHGAEGGPPDTVTEASEESFPASDPPAWS